jgi:large subunit ribosomal protein L21
MIRGSVFGGTMFAILRAGGKQVRVSPGDVIRVERPSGKVEKGQQLSLSEIVLAGDGTSFADVSVKATVLGEGRSRKVLVFKKKRTKQYRRTKGHRQTFVELRIDAIEGV